MSMKVAGMILEDDHTPWVWSFGSVFLYTLA